MNADYLRAKVIEIKGNRAVLELVGGDMIDKSILPSIAYKGVNYAHLLLHDPNMISELQRRHFWALAGDYSEFTGTPLEPSADWLKFQFMQEKQLPSFPSVAHGGMTKQTATEFLTFIIEYLISNDIPFRKQQFYLTADASRMLYALAMKRICWKCGKPNADIHHHENLVGAGMDRRKFDHTRSKFMALCRSCHNEVHAIGHDTFEEKYHLKAISLSEKDVKELDL